MDKNVPAGAAILLDFIRKTEVGSDGPDSYNVIYGHNQRKLAKPITSMTIGEIIDAQRGWSKNFGSSATGGYQFMRATLIDLSKELGLLGNQRFDANFQDRLGYHLLKRRGYEAFMANMISRTEFGKRLAQEWASFPVLAGTNGAHKPLKRGMSYYAGDSLNKSLVAPATVEAILDRVKAAPTAKPQASAIPTPDPKPVEPPKAAPAPAPKPASKAPGIIGLLLMLGAALAAIIAELLSKG